MFARLAALLVAFAIAVPLAGPALGSPSAAGDFDLAPVVSFDDVLQEAARPHRESMPLRTPSPRDILTHPGLGDVYAVFHDRARRRLVLTTRHVPNSELRRRVRILLGPRGALAHAPVVLRPTSRDADTSPFSAGAAIGYYDDDRPRCTSGFSWRTETGQPAMLTAGHCYPAGGEISVATNATPGFRYWVGHVAQTTVNSSGTLGINGDLALIDTTATADGTTLDRTGAARMFVGGATSATTVPVSGVSMLATLGSEVCYSSSVLGEECGPIDAAGHGGYTVVDTAFAYRSSDGRVWTGLALALKDWGYCVRRGESGSPVYRDQPDGSIAANGILNGGSGGDIEEQFVAQDSITGNCLMTFTQIGSAYQLWGGQVDVTG